MPGIKIYARQEVFDALGKDHRFEVGLSLRFAIAEVFGIPSRPLSENDVEVLWIIVADGQNDCPIGIEPAFSTDSSFDPPRDLLEVLKVNVSDRFDAHRFLDPYRGRIGFWPIPLPRAAFWFI
jgi:hypothetical protein